MEQSREKTRFQIWYCGECDRVGAVKYSKKDSDVMSVFYMLKEDHRTVSPQCRNSQVADRDSRILAITDLEDFKKIRKELGFED